MIHVSFFSEICDFHLSMKKLWWKEAVIYQIYPRSFKDSNGDGIGDIKGIIEKVDYISSLGVDVIWMGPVYPSPNADNGYDISNYCNIHPEFGDMADLEELLSLLHEKGMKLIMDVVVNHTSDEHQWFIESKSSVSSAKRDFYIWKAPAEDGGPPNNWKSFFGGSSWEYDESSGEYYLHLFSKKQPDLNWENPDVRSDIMDILRFWLDKGVDGFRMDVIPLISKKLDFADAPPVSFPKVVELVYSNGPKVHDYIQEINQKVLSHYDIMTVGEGPGISTKVGLDYVCEDRGELNMIFHLDHMFLGQGKGGKFDPVPYDIGDVKKIFNDWDRAIGDRGWISIFLDNHDFSRMVSRFGDDKKYRVESAKLLLTMILTLRGTPCIYQGSEIGMTNVAFSSIEDYNDVETLGFYKEISALGISEEEFLPLAHELSRDNARTPMQWDATENAGFSSGKPWIGVNSNKLDINVIQSEKEEHSILNYFREIMKWRKQQEAIIYGSYEDLSIEKEVYHYRRQLENTAIEVILNFSQDDKNVSIPDPKQLIHSNYQTNKIGRLQPWEAQILKSVTIN